MRQVYLLWHTHELGDGETSDKLLGVYSTEEEATNRIASARMLPGFKDAPDGFEVSPYEVDHDEWTEGYVTMNENETREWFRRGERHREDSGPAVEYPDGSAER